jgi:hypothetical protein
MDAVMVSMLETGNGNGDEYEDVVLVCLSHFK